jgi:hypothetical protein
MHHARYSGSNWELPYYDYSDWASDMTAPANKTFTLDISPQLIGDGRETLFFQAVLQMRAQFVFKNQYGMEQTYTLQDFGDLGTVALNAYYKNVANLSCVKGGSADNPDTEFTGV